MNSWYSNYESQCWYKNTFLVNRPDQISKTEKEEAWNNIEDSGCHFVCLSMIAGINPAHLASRLSEIPFFEPDAHCRSKDLMGKSRHLVWDQNKPNKIEEEVAIRKTYHPVRGMVDLRIKLVAKENAKNSQEARNIIKDSISEGRHIIFGWTDHSRLVAGQNDEDYFIWDPDLTGSTLQKNIDGEYSIQCIYDDYLKSEEYKDKIPEFWIYEVELLD